EVAVPDASSGTFLMVAADAYVVFSGSRAKRRPRDRTSAAVLVSPGDEGGPMTNGAIHTGTIDVGDLDLWTFTANVGDNIVVRIEIGRASCRERVWIRVYGATCELLNSSLGGVVADVSVAAVSISAL